MISGDQHLYLYSEPSVPSIDYGKSALTVDVLAEPPVFICHINIECLSNLDDGIVFCGNFGRVFIGRPSSYVGRLPIPEEQTEA